MAKEYVPIFFDWLDNTQDLNAEEKGHLIDAVIMYASGKDEWIDQLETSGEKIAFRFMRGQIDRNIAISKARSEAGSNKKDQNKTNDNKTEQNGSKIPKEKDKDKYNNNKKEENNYFDRFWSAYPRHVNKQGAMKAFDKAKIDGDLLNVILKAIEMQKASDQWTKDNGQYIPHPATWLNQRRWEDEAPKQTVKVLPAQNFPQRDYSDVQDELMANLAREMEKFNARGTG